MADAAIRNEARVNGIVTRPRRPADCSRLVKESDVVSARGATAWAGVVSRLTAASQGTAEMRTMVVEPPGRTGAVPDLFDAAPDLRFPTVGLTGFEPATP